MPITLTIKQVPERLAEKLRSRAAANHRSLQGELMSILNDSLDRAPHWAQSPEPAYRVKRAPAKATPHGRRLTLAELWERSRTLGSKSSSESTAIIRAARNERHRR